MTPSPPLDLDELERAARKATAGDWRVESHASRIGVVCGGKLIARMPITKDSPFRPQGEANAAFIAAANPQTVLILLAELRAKEAEAARFREALEPFAKAADIKLCGEFQDHESVQPTDTAWHIKFGHLRAARAALDGGERS